MGLPSVANQRYRFTRQLRIILSLLWKLCEYRAIEFQMLYFVVKKKKASENKHVAS